MVITKKRIRKLAPHLKGIVPGQGIFIALVQPDRHRTTLTDRGFSDALESGETVLPSAEGPISAFNAEGKYEVDKSRPMETAYRQIEWTWTEYHGRDNPVEQTDVKEMPYKRYPRTFIEPPAIELTAATSADGNKLIVSPQFEYTDHEQDRILHTINLFLELFGECSVLDSELKEAIRAPIRRLNWEVLPRGKMPWERLKAQLNRVIKSAPDGNQPVIERRFHAINTHGPEFTAVGNAGFQGYVVFGFPDRNLYVLESTQTNNATYLFRDDWERLSTLSKAEILRNDSHERRVIHRLKWFDEMNHILADGS